VTKNTRKLKINPKKILYRDLPNVAPSTAGQTVSAGASQITEMVRKGFLPRWYVVYHLHRRFDNYADELLDQDLWTNKDSLYRILCGSRWQKKRIRPRSVWSLEWGDSGERPHINLLIEDIPKYSNDYASVDYIFNYRLPRKVKCIMHKSADVQPVRIDDAFGLYRYINSESKWNNMSINYTLTDWIR